MAETAPNHAPSSPLGRAASGLARAPKLSPPPPLARTALIPSAARPLGVGAANLTAERGGPPVAGDFAGVTAPLVFASVRRRLPSPPPAPPSMPAGSAAAGSSAMRQVLTAAASDQLDDVRLHANPASEAMAANLGAAAFTLGRHIFFGHKRLAPEDSRGRALLAHELVHARQQREGASKAGQPGSPENEREAQAAEHQVLAEARGSTQPAIAIDHFEGNYSAQDGRQLSAREVARLDSISQNALAVCRRTIGEVATEADLGTVRVSLDLDLEGLSDGQIAQRWGQALAREIKARLERAAPELLTRPRRQPGSR